MKNTFANSQSGSTPTNPFSLPFVLYGSDAFSNPIQTKLTNSYINDNTIAPAKITAGTNLQVLTTVGGITTWASASAGTSNFADTLFTIFNNADPTKILTFENTNITTGTTIQIKYSKSLTFPTTTDLSGQVLTSLGGGIITWATPAPQSTVFQDDTFQIQDNADPTSILEFVCDNISSGQTRLLTMSDYDNDLNVFQTQSISLRNSGFLTTLQSGTLASSLNFTLPVNYGTAGQFLTTNGLGILSWSTGSGTSFPVSDTVFTVQNTADPTKQWKVDCSAINAGQTRTITMMNRNLNLQTPTFDSLSLFNSTSGFATSLISAPTAINQMQYILPDTTGTNNYVLCTDGLSLTNANLSWKTVSSVATAFSDTVFQVYSNSDINQLIKFTVTNGSSPSTLNMISPQVNAINSNIYNYEYPFLQEVRFYDNTRSGVYTTLRCETPASNTIFNLPSTVGLVNQVLSSTGVSPCNLFWQSQPRTPFSNVLQQQTAGTYSFTVPSTISMLYVICIGGGAAGDGVNGTAANSTMGSGGSGGGWVEGFISVTPGQIINYVVGLKGSASGIATAGGSGQTSYFGPSLVSYYLLSTGGTATTHASITNVGLGGQGGIGPLFVGTNFMSGRGSDAAGYNNQTGNFIMRAGPGGSTWKFHGPNTGRSVGVGQSYVGQSATASPGCGAEGSLACLLLGVVSGGNGADGAMYIYY